MPFIIGIMFGIMPIMPFIIGIMFGIMPIMPFIMFGIIGMGMFIGIWLFMGIAFIMLMSASYAAPPDPQGKRPPRRSFPLLPRTIIPLAG
jgi:hypothetical protein